MLTNLVLTIKTDQPEAELCLFDAETRLEQTLWQAHRQLAETIHTKITETLQKQGKTLASIQGIVCYEGPGSFTGLRIGVSVANALSVSLGIPIIGTSGEHWQSRGLEQLQAGRSQQLVVPEYGAPARTTAQKK